MLPRTLLFTCNREISSCENKHQGSEASLLWGSLISGNTPASEEVTEQLHMRKRSSACDQEISYFFVPKNLGFVHEGKILEGCSVKYCRAAVEVVSQVITQDQALARFGVRLWFRWQQAELMGRVKGSWARLVTVAGSGTTARERWTVMCLQTI